MSEKEALETVRINNIEFDLFPADNDAVRTQDGWNNYHNLRGSFNLCLPHYLDIGLSGDKELSYGVRLNCRNYEVCTGTRHVYEVDYLLCDVVHNYGSTVVEQVTNKVLVPESSTVPLDELLRRDDGLLYSQAIFSLSLKSPRSAEEISEGLECLAGCSAKKIYVWIPSKTRRARNPGAEVFLSHDGGNFHIYCGRNLTNKGRSRGGRLSNAVKR